MFHAGLLVLFSPKTGVEVTLVEFYHFSFRPNAISKVVLKLSKENVKCSVNCRHSSENM